MRIVALDIETTGLDPDRDQILQVGMLCFDTSTGHVFGEFETLVSHYAYSGSAFALSMNADILSRLASNTGEDSTCSIGELGAVMARQLGEWDLSRPVALGFNVGAFDLAFLKARGVDLFHHRAVEVGSLLMPTNMSPVPVSSSEYMGDDEVAHTALEDCKMARAAYIDAFLPSVTLFDPSATKKLRVSHSGMSTYRICPMQYYLGRVEGIEAVETKRAPSFGSAGHAELEKMAGGDPEPKNYHLSKEDTILMECLIIGYRTMYGKIEGKPEQHFVVPIIGPDGKPADDVELQGYIDIETDDYVMDHKFTSANITDTYLAGLHRSPQAEEYLIAVREGGSKASYAIWDIIKSNKYKRRLATPERDREYYKVARKDKWAVGDPKKGTYLQDETWEEFRERIVADIAENPGKFYHREEIHKTIEELDRRRYDIYSTAKMMKFSTDNKAFPRNEAGCSRFGGCEYQDICWNGVDPAQSELYTINKRKGQ